MRARYWIFPVNVTGRTAANGVGHGGSGIQDSNYGRGIADEFNITTCGGWGLQIWVSRAGIWPEIKKKISNFCTNKNLSKLSLTLSRKQKSTCAWPQMNVGIAIERRMKWTERDMESFVLVRDIWHWIPRASLKLSRETPNLRPAPFSSLLIPFRGIIALFRLQKTAQAKRGHKHQITSFPCPPTCTPRARI